MGEQLTYSIVVPVHNGGGSLEELSRRLVEVMSPFSYELIFVNDGSTDNSWNVITGLKSKYPGVIRAFDLSRNYGQHAALLCAFSVCGRRYVITIDDDLQYDPEDILLLIGRQQETGAEVVYGLLPERQDAAMRRFATWYITRTSRLENKNGRGSSFRLISKAITDIIAAGHKCNFVYIDEVLQWYTSSFAYVNVHHRKRVSGRSGYSIRTLFSLYLNIITNYSAAPLRLMVYAGGFFSVLFFLVGVVFILRKLAYNVPVGYTSIIVTILFSASIIMFCLGVIGLYLFKIYAAQQNKPLYTIKRTL